MPGLYISYKKHTLRAILLWLVGLVLLAIAGAIAWAAWNYYITGTRPPVIGNLLSSALAKSSLDETTVSDADRRAHTVGPTEPRYLSVPSLGLENVRVFGVGLTQSGALDTPRNIYDAAWYNKSAHPGDGFGVVVIDAHNGGVRHDGIFAKLQQLGVGDRIILERGDGTKVTYAVAENNTRSLDYANKTGMKEIFAPVDPDKEGLGLITCAGVYVPRLGLYDKRVLVRAVRVD